MQKLIVLFIAAIAGLTGCMLSIDNLSFLGRAEHLAGKVSSVTASEEQCHKSGKTPKTPKPCTRYYATIDYQHNNTPRQLIVSAGQTSGRNHPVSLASYQPGMVVDVIYDPRSQVAYRDHKPDLWYKAIICFVIVLLMLFIWARIPEK